MIAIDTEILSKIVFFGGEIDGVVLSVDNVKEKVRTANNLYVESFYVDNQGRSVYYAARGPGRLSKKYVDKLFAEEDVI